MIEDIEAVEAVRASTARLTREILAEADRAGKVPPEVRPDVVRMVAVDFAKEVLADWGLDDLGFEALVGVAQKAIDQEIAAWPATKAAG